MQSALLKEYPNKMLVTVTQCVFSTIQSFVVAVVAERDFSKWKLRFDINLIAVIYTVIIISVLWIFYYLLLALARIKVNAYDKRYLMSMLHGWMIKISNG